MPHCAWSSVTIEMMFQRSGSAARTPLAGFARAQAAMMAVRKRRCMGCPLLVERRPDHIRNREKRKLWHIGGVESIIADISVPKCLGMPASPKRGESSKEVLMTRQWLGAWCVLLLGAGSL